MSKDLEEARKTPLFSSPALTKLLWFPNSRTAADRLVDILQKEPVFQKNEKYGAQLAD